MDPIQPRGHTPGGAGIVVVVVVVVLVVAVVLMASLLGVLRIGTVVVVFGSIGPSTRKTQTNTTVTHVKPNTRRERFWYGFLVRLK